MIPNLEQWSKELFNSDLSYPTKYLLLTLAIQHPTQGISLDFDILSKHTGIQSKRIGIYFNEAIKQNWIDSCGNLLCIERETRETRETEKERTKEKDKEKKEKKEKEYSLTPENLNAKKEKTHPSGRTKSSQNVYFEIAKKISSIVLQYKNMNYPTHVIRSWAKEIKTLKSYGVSFERMQKVLNWYELNYDLKYCPVVECGESFRKKFTKLERQMNQNSPSPSISKYSHHSKKFTNPRIPNE